jgi:hypothetical protein
MWGTKKPSQVVLRGSNRPEVYAKGTVNGRAFAQYIGGIRLRQFSTLSQVSKSARAKCFVVFLRLGRSQAYLLIYELQEEKRFPATVPPWGVSLLATLWDGLEMSIRTPEVVRYTRNLHTVCMVSRGSLAWRRGDFFPYTVWGGFGSKNLRSPSPYYAPRVPNPTPF